MSDFVGDLLARADIAEIIGAEVALKRQGSRLVGLCPFHQEKTPSFSVNPQNGLYHCFGCGVGGNALSFLRDYRCGGDARAALHELAKICGVEVPSSGGGRAPPPIAPRLEKALSFYRQALAQSKRARAYLQKRGVSEKTAARFALGYAPDGWRGLRPILSDYDDGDLPVKAGLVRAGDKGRYDYFRDRIMFPIFSGDGKIAGFGGRLLGDGEPKYLNSPQTALFDKSRALFGLHLARARPPAGGRTINKRVIVTEGYMDVVALAEAGVDGAVATMGTAATAAQMAQLARLAADIVFCFDGDDAGRRAAWRALENILPQLADSDGVSFLLLPAGEDPDSFVRKNARDGFEKELTKASALGDFLMSELPPDEKNRANPETREAALLRRRVSLIERINRNRAPLLYTLLARRLADASGVKIADLRRAARAQPSSSRNSGSARDDGGAPRGDGARRNFVMPHSPLFRLLWCLAAKPALAGEMANAPLAGDPREVAAVEAAWRKLAAAQNDQTARPLPELLREEGYDALAAQLENTEQGAMAAVDPAREFAHIVALLAKARARRAAARAVAEQIAGA